MNSRLLLLFGGGGGFKASDVTDIPESEAQALIDLYNATDGKNWTDNTGWLADTTANNWYGVTVAGGHVTWVQLGLNNLIGDIGTWAIDKLPNLDILYLNSNISLSGDISGWAIPSVLRGLKLYADPVSGDISVWTMPSSMTYLYLNSTSLSAGPDVSGATPLLIYSINDCALSQAAVDAIVQEIYTNRASYTNAAPALNIGGTNSAPSGIYQDAVTPSTGKEYIYKIVNDPDLEGFNKWTVTYTA